MSMTISPELVERLQEAYGGNLFEGCWADGALEGSFFRWAQSAWPKWYSEHPGDVVALECVIGDEEGRDCMAAFLNHVSPAQRFDALSRLRDALADMDLEPSGRTALEELDGWLASATPVAESVPVDFFDAAQAAFDEEEYDEVIRLLSRAIERQPSARAYLGRGYAQASLADYAAALDDFSQAIELDATCAEAYFQRARMFGFQRNESDALADVRRAIELDPRYRTRVGNESPAFVRIQQELGLTYKPTGPRFLI